MAKAKKDELDELEDELDDLEDLDDDEVEDEDDEDEAEEPPVDLDDDEDEDDAEEKPAKKGKKDKAKKASTRTDGRIGTKELAEALNTDGRNLRVMLRDRKAPKNGSDGTRYEWNSVEHALKQMKFKSLKEAQAALKAARDSRLEKLKEAGAEKREAKAKGKGKKKQPKVVEDDDEDDE